MNDKKHDELEALLIERAENLNDPEAYHGDIAEVMLKAADAIAELRVKNAGLAKIAHGLNATALSMNLQFGMALRHDTAENFNHWHTEWKRYLKENTQ